jgi:hypothetical protein
VKARREQISRGRAAHCQQLKRLEEGQEKNSAGAGFFQ